MTTLAMTLPVARRSPIYMPRRDLTLDSGDSLTLQLTLVTADRPDATPLDIVGIGPVVRLLICHDAEARCDYGRPVLGPVLWTATAAVVDGINGRADVTIPRDTLSGWGRRLGWGIQLDYLGDLSLIAYGALHTSQGAALPLRSYDLTDSNDQTILTETDLDVEA